MLGGRGVPGSTNTGPGTFSLPLLLPPPSPVPGSPGSVFVAWHAPGRPGRRLHGDDCCIRGGLTAELDGSSPFGRRCGRQRPESGADRRIGRLPGDARRTEALSRCGGTRARRAPCVIVACFFQPELHEHRPDVRLDGLRAQAKPLPDRLVRSALGDEGQHLTFAIGQVLERGSARAAGAADLSRWSGRQPIRRPRAAGAHR